MRFHVSFLRPLTDDYGYPAGHVRAIVPADDGHPRAYDRPLAEAIVAAFAASGVRGARLEPTHPDADSSMFEE